MKEKKGKGMFIFICILVFIFSFIVGIVSKIAIKPAWSKEYTVEWTDEIGTLVSDISYGDKESNKFDLYLPKDNLKRNYGLVVYLHAGGFTSGDKIEDKDTLAWLCSKGYVACGINYTLRTDTNNASVYTQSMEIKQAMPVVIEEAKKLGYNINEMAISGGSAGGTLAMLYAYRDSETSPVPVKLMFEMVGPSSFYTEDWGVYGLDQDTDESRKAAAGLFGIMVGVELTPEMIKTKEYEKLMKPISSFMWINENSVPSVIAYGTHDIVCPFNTVRHLIKALQDNNIDYKYFEGKHSGHGMQNDDKVFEQYMKTVDEYLEKYLSIQN
ncbi:alpha/beta hydrolase [uncultured Clostridium sp.]|uniref:alpha/beta hydrolase n=1 Tax=uncultured Clostridium sp. TaxID=59620 RepID=UPI00272E6758|nr:alpha/beta hydrolase [uncultured Clostridium sp.]